MVCSTNAVAGASGRNALNSASARRIGGFSSRNATGEPAGLSRHDFLEDRLPRLVRRAVEEQRISLGRAAEILGLTREEMRRQARAWAR